MSNEERIAKALEIARYGNIGGAHHKAWVIDQMVRALTGCPVVMGMATDYQGREYSFETFGESDAYRQFVAEHDSGEDGPGTYQWDKGIAP